MKDVTFGQYYPVESFVHKCDPRAKILFLIGYLVAVFLSADFYGLAACAVVLVLCVAFSRVPVRSVLRSIKGVLFLIVFTAILNLLFYQGETTVVIADVPLKWGIINITVEGIRFMIFVICRIFMLVMVSAILTLTTTPVSLTDGLESLLTPLKWIRVPVHELALIMSIALRMIPTLMDEIDRIMNAQKARGADFSSGGPVKRVKAVIPVLIPLLLSALRRAEELGDAMEARCYTGSEHRTRYKKLTFTWRDPLIALLCAALIAGVVLMNVYLPPIL